MGENTKIQWAHHTFNPWRGCVKVAPGCANCYAEAQSKRNQKTLGIWGANGTRVVASESMWREPVKWNRDASFVVDLGEQRPRVFCASLADVFEDWRGSMCDARGRVLYCAEPQDWTTQREIDEYPFSLPTIAMGDVRSRLFRLIDATPHLDWLLLTKRPENIRRMWPQTGFANAGVPGTLGRHVRLDNVRLGTSIACQEDADRNIPELLKCRDLAANLFLSIEPLVGPVDLSKWLGLLTYSPTAVIRTMPNGMTYPHPSAGQTVKEYASLADWVIVGGESGPNARPCRLEWIRSIVRQCKDAGVPVFVKQLGSRPDGLRFRMDERGRSFCEENSFSPGSTRPLDPKGGDPSEWPEDLRVREVPE